VANGRAKEIGVVAEERVGLARPSRREVVSRLAAAQKSNRGAAGYSRWVNRPLGRQFAAVAYLAGLRPNQVSLISACFTYAAIVLVAAVEPTWPLAIAVVALLVIGYAMDSADGQVARLSGTGSVAGEWLDHVLDALKIATFHLAIAITWFRHYELTHASWLLVPLGFGAVSSVFFFALILSDLLRRIERVKGGGTAVTTASVNPNEKAPVLRSLVVLPNDYGLLCLVMVLLPLHRTFTAVYTFLAACNALFLAAGLYRWFREMNGLRAVQRAG
jgi:phosphatidylglycerophosphate synthase